MYDIPICVAVKSTICLGFLLVMYKKVHQIVAMFLTLEPPNQILLHQVETEPQPRSYSGHKNDLPRVERTGALIPLWRGTDSIRTLGALPGLAFHSQPTCVQGRDSSHLTGEAAGSHLCKMA